MPTRPSKAAPRRKWKPTYDLYTTRAAAEARAVKMRRNGYAVRVRRTVGKGIYDKARGVRYTVDYVE